MKQNSIMMDVNGESTVKILQRPFYARPTILVAVDLLGKILFHNTPKGVVTGKIVEVEAYLGERDPACHAFNRKARRAKIFFGTPGIAYIFINYGIHSCLNAITEKPNIAGCVLIRALEPIGGIPMMKENRGVDDLLSITNGPGKLTQALGVSFNQNGVDLTQGDLLILDNEDYFNIVVTSRIGISKAEKEPLRFAIHGNQFVSPQNRAITTFLKGSPEMVKNAFDNGTLKVTLNHKNLSTRLATYTKGG